MKKILPLSLLVITLLTTTLSRAQETAIPKRPRITGVAHMALYVKNMESARQFYKDFLGYAEPYTLKSKDGQSLALSFIKINDHQLLEIFPEKSPDGNRMYHFAVETDDAEGMRKYLAAKGCTVPKETPVGRTGNLNYFVTDPNGTICEIVQYGKEGFTAKNFGKDLPSGRVSSRMSHVGFMVPDVEKALAFYRDILGFQETWRGSSDGAHVTWVNLKVPEGNDYIELMLYDKEPSKTRVGSMNHICLEVKDVKTALSLLKTRVLPAGCQMPDTTKVGINRKRQFNLFDADGTRVEVMEDNTMDGKPVPSSPLPPMKFVKP